MLKEVCWDGLDYREKECKVALLFELKYSSSSFSPSLFLINVVLAILCSLHFYVNFIISFRTFSSAVIFLGQGMFISLCSILYKFFRYISKFINPLFSYVFSSALPVCKILDFSEYFYFGSSIWLFRFLLFEVFYAFLMVLMLLY